MKQSLLKLFVTAFVAATAAVGAMAQIPHDYYQSLKGKKGAELKTAIHNLVKEAYVLSYGSKDGSTWWGFYLTDNDNGKVIDRYSNETYMFVERGKSVAGTNIEHSFPKSWWGGTETQAYKDLFNLMPSDRAANNQKSNYGMGVVTQTSGKGYYNNDCIKVGDSGMGFKVWQPSKYWQGDFARGYMYMATAYQDYVWASNEAKSSLEQNEWPTLQKWAYTLYIKWAKEDPVNEIEVKRNNAVYSIQGNRNPYIDFPNLMEYVWGDSIDVAFDPETSVKSTIILKDNNVPIPTTPDGIMTLYMRSFGRNAGGCTVATDQAPASGKDVWTRDVKYGWVANAFSGKAYASDVSLTTPEISLKEVDNAKFRFKHALNNCTEDPTRYLSVEVLCEGKATKIEGITWPEGTNWTFKPAGEFDLTPFVGKTIKIAFHYTSTASFASTWEIASLEVEGKKTPTAIAPPSLTTQGFDPSMPYEVYSLSGIKLPSTTQGVVIVRQNGKSWKVVR